MKNYILPFDWQNQVSEAESNSINDDIILIEKPHITTALSHPFKVNVTTAIICLTGRTAGTINLKHYEMTAPCLIILLPDQILEYKSISEDFSAQFIIMSKRFTENLNIEDRFPAFMSIQKKPCIALNEQELEALTDYYKMLKRTVSYADNPYRLQIAKHLTKAFFYGFGHRIHISQQNEEIKKPKKQIFVENFLALVQQYHNMERNLDFYADKLCLTPKYLSKLIKENTGISASQWIDNYVVSEAKALLKSTDMTIQQISDELHFPSQSFFGKYFKRIEGVSPREYRNENANH